MYELKFLSHWIALILSAVTCLQAGASAWIEPNMGQSNQHYDYVIRASDMVVLVAPNYIDFRLPASSKAAAPAKKAGRLPDDSHTQDAPATLRSLYLRMQLIGANPEAKAQTGAVSGGVSHYFKGAQPSAWLSDVPHIQEIRYRNVYPGVDLVYRLNKGHLEYDFEVAANADTSNIRLHLDGADDFTINQNGQWVTTTKAGELRHLAPVVFQTRNGKRHEVDGEFVDNPDGTISFNLAQYSKDEPLTIDPVIEFSGYVGGSGIDEGTTLLETATGNYLLLGTTTSLDLIGTIPGQFGGYYDAFLMEIDAATGNPNWVSIIGGTATEYPRNMQLDSQGNIVVVGTTASADFPVINAFQSVFAGTEDPLYTFAPWDMTISKISADGSTMLFSTYLGGVDVSNIDAEGYELIRGVAIAEDDSIFVAGQTAAPDFPVTHNFMSRSCIETDLANFGGVIADTFVAKFASDGTRLLSICVGGSLQDYGRDVVLGTNGEIFIAGFGNSQDLPGTGGYYQPLPTQNFWSPFVMKLNQELTAIEYATYIGEGRLTNIAVDDQGAIFGSGLSLREMFPVTPGAFQTATIGNPGNTATAFVFKLRPDASSLEYATYLGGSGFELSSTIAIDDIGRAYVAGTTRSQDFPVHQPVFDGAGVKFAGVSNMLAITGAQDLQRRLSSNLLDYGYSMYVARDGVNMHYRTFSFDGTLLGTPSTIGNLELDSRAVLPLDLDGDGFEHDLLFANSGAANSLYQWNSGGQNYVLSQTLGAPDGDSRAVTAIFDGPNTSFVIANFGAPNELYVGNNTTPVLLGRADGRTTSVATGVLGPSANGSSIVFGNDQQDVRLLPALGNGNYGTPIVITNGATAVTSLQIGDVNGDGENDLVIGNKDAPNQVVIFIAGVPLAPQNIDTLNEQTLDLLLLDTDGDFDPDLLVANATEDRYYQNDGSGNFLLGESFKGNANATTAISKPTACFDCEGIYLSSETGLQRIISSEQSMFVSVLDPTGSALEFSTLINGGGVDNTNLHVGLSLGTGAGSRLLIAGDTNGSQWPVVGSTSAPLAYQNSVFMVLNLDQDNDGVLDGSDNCLLQANAGQYDSNADGFGNACDPDLNNDGIVNFGDVVMWIPFFNTPHGGDADFNGDGFANFGDYVLFPDFFLQAPGPSGIVPVN